MRHVLGVGKPSPLKTWPRCPPQAVQVISVRSMPQDLSVWRLTAPGMAAERDISRLCHHRLETTRSHTIVERRPTTAALELGLALVQRSVASSARVHALLIVLVELASAGSLCAFLAEDAELDQQPRADSSQRT